jgi:Domain of unknown function (DUF4062)
MATIYLSSTYEDLKDCRQQVFKMLQKMGHSVVGMENYTANWAAPLESCLEDVARCDYYLGIFAWRYGHIPENNNPEGKSITELEYREAVKRNIRPLIFLVHKDAKWSPDLVDSDTTRIRELRRNLANNHMVSFFKNCEEFPNVVKDAISKALDDSLDEPSIWERYAKLIIGIIAVVFVLALFIAYQMFYRKKSVDGPPIGNGNAQPKERVNEWTADFTKAEKLDDHWHYPKGMWSTEPGELVNLNKDDEALLVKGQEMGIPSDLNGEVFCDFRAVFEIRFKTGGTSAAWVLRAQPDRASGYLFELVQEGADLTFRFWIYEHGKKQGHPLKSQPISSGKLSESNSLYIDVVVTGNKFDYVITFGDDEPDENTKVGYPVKVDFLDDPSNVRWPCGTIGFLMTDDTSVMRVESVSIEPHPKKNQ